MALVFVWHAGVMSILHAGLTGLLGVDHIGIATPDLDAAITLHTSVLGMTLVHREENREQLVAEAMLVGTADPAPDGLLTQVQLVAPLAEGSAVHRFLERHGPGLHHVAYRVDDIRAMSGQLRRQGWRVLYDAPKAGTRGSLINFIHPKDTGGVLLELVEPVERRSAASDRDRG